MAKAQKQTTAEELTALRAQANAIHETRYKENEKWTGQLRGINDRIVELEQKLKDEAVNGTP